MVSTSGSSDFKQSRVRADTGRSAAKQLFKPFLS